MEKICGILNCTKKVFARSLCKNHYSKQRRIEEDKPIRPHYGNKCIIEECEKIPWCRGMCRHHYRIWNNNRKGKIIIPRGFYPKICSVDGCERPSAAKGLCSTHYDRFMEHGDPLYKTQYESRSGVCIVENCHNPILARKLCGGHYTILMKYGIDPSKPPFECYICGSIHSYWNLAEIEVDHIIPKSRGGDNSPENVNVACRKCNHSKNDATMEEFISWCHKVIAHQTKVENQ